MRAVKTAAHLRRRVRAVQRSEPLPSLLSSLFHADLGNGTTQSDAEGARNAMNRNLQGAGRSNCSLMQDMQNVEKGGSAQPERPRVSICFGRHSRVSEMR